MTYGYIITFSNGDYENVIPNADIVAREIYTSIEDAVASINLQKLNGFTPVLYGQVYPFNNTTLKEEVEQKSRGIYGWIKEDNDHISICILKYHIK